MVHRFEDLYYESEAYMGVMRELDELRDRLSWDIDTTSGQANLTGLVEEFWRWAEKAEKMEKDAFERGETNWDGSEEYEEGRNYRWVLQDLSDIKKLDGHAQEKELLAGYESFYKEHYFNK